MLRKLALTLISLVVISIFFCSCGRKSLPKPPEDRAPLPVGDARIEAKSRSVVLIWKAPTENAGGDEILELRSFNILRKTSSKGVSSDFVELAVISLDKDTDLSKEFSYEDSNIELGLVYDYIIVPRDTEGIEAEPSTILRLSFH